MNDVKTRTRRDLPIVVPVLRDIPHPGQSLIPALFNDLQVSDLNARHREVWNLEFDREWWSCGWLDVCKPRWGDMSARGRDKSGWRRRTALDAWKTKVSSHEVLATTAELLDLPRKCGLVWDILDAPRRRLINFQGEPSVLASPR